jgi:hypothetical protein
METIDYSEYDRITDTLMYLSDDIAVNFTLALSRKSRNGERLFYHYESMYGSDKFGSSQRSIKRNMNFYFVIDIRSNFNAGFIIRLQDKEMIVRLIESKVLPWYFGNAAEQAFQIIGDKISLTDYQPVIYTQAGLYDTKLLSFEPVVYIENELECRGIRLSLSTGYSVSISIDKFMGFYSLLKSDMYAIAASMATYAKTQPYGINSHNMSGLGAKPPTLLNENWKSKGFNSNSFLDNVKSKREGE